MPGIRGECGGGGTGVCLDIARRSSTGAGRRRHVDTGWGAGADPEQRIELDLGQQYELVCIRLLTDQFPAGRTTHRINGGAHDNPGAELGIIEAETEYGEWLELAGTWNVESSG